MPTTTQTSTTPSGQAPPGPTPSGAAQTRSRWGVAATRSPHFLLIATHGLTAILVSFGVFMVLSASMVTSLDNSRGLSPIDLFVKQAQFAVLGAGAYLFAMYVPLSTWKKIALPLWGVSVVLQLLVFTKLGVEVNGNLSWLELGFARIQPAEFAKIALVLCAGLILTHKHHLLQRWDHAVIPFVFPLGAVSLGLVLLGGDLGTALVIMAILAMALFLAGARLKHLAVAGLGVAGLLLILVLTASHRVKRITNGWLNCEKIQEDCWQVRNGQIAFADGGWTGVGLGAGRAKWNWLPEAHNDFIFSTVGEELGLFGALFVLVTFAVLAWVMYQTVLVLKDQPARIMVGCISVWIMFQVVENMGSTTGLLPVIGVPLPFISSGGSALLSVMTAMGIIASHLRHMVREERGIPTSGTTKKKARTTPPRDAGAEPVAASAAGGRPPARSGARPAAQPTAGIANQTATRPTPPTPRPGRATQPASPRPAAQRPKPTNAGR